MIRGGGRVWLPKRRRGLTALVVALAAAAHLQLVRADDVRVCAGSGLVSARAAQASDAETVCEGAARALAFMAGLGLHLDRATQIEVVDRLPENLGREPAGCFIRGSARILVQSYAAFEARRFWFGLPVDRELHRSVAVHETAHAIVGCHASPTLPGPAHEYVAYVVMFATMDPPIRARVLEKFPGSGFEDIARINPITYYFDPMQFGADAWRDYLTRPDGAAWLRAILDGKVVPEFPLGVW